MSPQNLYRSLCVTGEVSDDVIRSAFSHHEIEFTLEEKILRFDVLTHDLQYLYGLLERDGKIKFQEVTYADLI